MSMYFFGEGNIGLLLEYCEFFNGNDEFSCLLCLNVYFDNFVFKKDGIFEDCGGFWVLVEIWYCDVEYWKDLYQKGMCVLVIGCMECEFWMDNEDQLCEIWQINVCSVGILLYCIEFVVFSLKLQEVELKLQVVQELIVLKEVKCRK